MALVFTSDGVVVEAARTSVTYTNENRKSESFNSGVKSSIFSHFFDSVYNSVAYVPVKVRMGSESKTTNQSQYPVSSTVHLIGVFVRTCSQLFPTSNAISDETWYGVQSRRRC